MAARALRRIPTHVRADDGLTSVPCSAYQAAIATRLRRVPNEPKSVSYKKNKHANRETPFSRGP